MLLILVGGPTVTVLLQVAVVSISINHLELLEAFWALQSVVLNYYTWLTPTCRMDLVSQQQEADDLSTQAAELIWASWTKGTEKQYKPVWKIWRSWCDQRHINPLRGNAVYLVNLLAEQFHKVKS